MIIKILKIFLRILRIIFCITLIVVALYFAFWGGYKMATRNHGNVYINEVITYTESSKVLKNPNRGFYFMYGFRIKDENDEDYYNILSKRFISSHAHSLVMIQVNLQEYADGPISENGLEDINKLFEAMSQFDKQYLIRFLYDWNGENKNVEPESADIILMHMEQLQNIFEEYHNIIFVHQGLFIGNWGEMNGTIHLDSMKTLAEKLLEVSKNEMFLSVRMPAQWRKITQIADPQISVYSNDHITRKIGLFNDGMMGSFSDYGTYGSESKNKVGYFTHWNRTEELIFQEELCKYVPNGGEVIKDNEYNDFPNAIETLKQMRITYLNWDYDRTVLEKWKAYTISDDTVYDGMDGLTYVERHLGYRFLIRNVELGYKKKNDLLTVKVDLQNVGFAPIYKPAEVYIQIVNIEKKASYTYLVQVDLSSLVGGYDNDMILEITHNQELLGYGEGVYELYFMIKDVDSGLPIYLANEQEYGEYGYKLGTISIENWKESLYNCINNLTKK